MGQYLVERYLSSMDRQTAAADGWRVAEAAGAELLLTLYCPHEELCFHLLEASTAVAVERAGATVGVQLDRVSSVLAINHPTPHQRQATPVAADS